MKPTNKSPLAAAASKMLSGNMLVVLLQAANFILLARMMGSTEFGKIAAINAVATILIPLSGLGFGNILLMNLSRDRSHAALYCGNALLVQGVSGVLGAALGMAIAMFLLAGKASLFVVATILICELMLNRTATLLSQYFSATENYGGASVTNVSASFVRVCAIGLTPLLGATDAESWARASLMLTTLYAAILVAILWRQCGGLQVDTRMIRRSLGQGFSFSFSVIAKSIYTDGDKAILARTAAIDTVGLYASAYRLAAMAFMPVRALLDASAARFFQEGQHGLRAATRFAMKLMVYALGYACVAGLILYGLGPWIHVILGPSYQGTQSLIQALAVLPAIQVVHYLLSDALTGANHQNVRSSMQLVVLILYGALGLTLIPSMGAQGALITCVVSEATLAVLVTLAVLYMIRQQARHSGHPQDQP